MAQVRDIKARISLDGESAFRKALSMSNNSLKAMREELKTVTSEFNQNDDAVEKTAKAQEILRKMQEQSEQKIQALSDAVEYQSRKYQEAQAAADQAAEAYGYASEEAIHARKAADDAASATDKYSKMLYSAQGEANKLSRELEDISNSSDSSADSFDDVSDSFRRALSMSNASLKSMREELKTVTSEFNQNDDAVEKTAKAQEILRKMQEQSEQKIQALSEAVEYQSRKYQEAQAAADQAAEAYGYASEEAINARKTADDAASATYKYSEMLYSAQGEANKLSRELEDISNSSDSSADSFDDVSDSLEDVNERSDKASDGFTTMKGVAANLYTEGIKFVTDGLHDMYDLLLESDSAVGSFAVKTGTAASDMGQYKDIINDIYESGNGESLSNVSDTMALVVQQFGDLNDADLSDITENLFTMESYFGYDAQEQLRAVKMLMDQFGISSDEAFSMMIQGSQQGLDKNGDLLDSINEYAVHYQQLGYDADDFFNSLANGTASGTFSVDKLGDAMKEFGIRTKDTADSTTEGFSLIGLDADEMREKFSQGGETARQATEDTLTALFQMDDQVKMNQAGVDLFGTMWEDLGAAGVKALMNVNGNITTSKKTLEEVDKIKFNGVERRTESLGRKFKTEITQPIFDKAMPKLESAMDYVSNNMDHIIDTIKKVGEAMKIALAIGTVTKFVSSAVSGMFAVIDAIKAAKDAQLLLNAAQKANLFGLIAGVAVGAGIAIYDYYRNLEDSLEPTSLVSEKTQELCDKLSDQRTKWEEAKDAADTNIKNKDAEFQYYEGLKAELDGIVDGNGRIKEGYENRAKFITEELGDVTGEEIEIVDGVIQKYDELSVKLDEVLLKKKGEAYANIYADQFSEALSGKDDSLNAYMEAQSNYNSFRTHAIYTDSGQRNLRIAELEKQNARLREYDIADPDVVRELDQLKQEAADERILQQALMNAEDMYSEYSTTIANYQQLQQAITSGTKDELETSMYYLENHFATAETATSGYLQRQAYRINNELDNTKTAVANGMAGVTQEDVTAMENMNIKAGIEWRKATSNAQKSMDDTVAAAAELSGKLWSPMAAAAATGGSTFKATFDAQDTPSAFNGLLERSQNIAYELYNNAAYAANMSADGYLYTMEERRRQLEASVSYTASMISNAFNSALGIASPSKKFGWAAEMSVAGYINTINDSLPEMHNAGRTMAESAVTPFEQYLSEHSVSPEAYANAAIGTADRISNRGNTQNLNRTANVTVNLNGLSIGNVNSEDDIRKVMQRIAAETQKAVFVTGGGVK